jgi:hypothetical protein
MAGSHDESVRCKYCYTEHLHFLSAIVSDDGTPPGQIGRARGQDGADLSEFPDNCIAPFTAQAALDY